MGVKLAEITAPRTTKIEARNYEANSDASRKCFDLEMAASWHPFFVMGVKPTA